MKIKRILFCLVAYSGALLVAESVSAQEMVQYVHTDALGSPVAISDATGAVIEKRSYEPYGSSSLETADRPAFTGHVSDSATGLTYMQQRYYDSDLGTFLSSDPVTPFNQVPGQFNRYRYANGNPFTNIDPDGRACTGSRIRSVCEGGGVAQLRTSVAGAGAARQANIALRAGGAFKPFEDKHSMYNEWARLVEPVAESWGFEIASLIYKAGGGRFRLGAAYSDGASTSVGGVLSGSREGMVGFIHNHPSLPVMSAADMMASRVDGSLYRGPGNNSYWGDLSTAVGMRIDAVMVRDARIYEFSFERYQREMADPAGKGDIRLGDLVREIR